MTDLSAPARDIFPEFNTIPRLFEEEVRGLPKAALARHRPEKGWGGWSISEQVSHAAWIPYLIFCVIWRETLFGDETPPHLDRTDTGGADRMLDPGRFYEMPNLLGARGDGFALGWILLGRETLGSMREKVLARDVNPDRQWATGERVIDYFEQLVAPAHKVGLRRDENDPYIFHQTFECAMRHIIWEALVHLKTIQMHKAAEGLPTGPPVSEEGYVKLLEWD